MSLEEAHQLAGLVNAGAPTGGFTVRNTSDQDLSYFRTVNGIPDGAQPVQFLVLERPKPEKSLTPQGDDPLSRIDDDELSVARGEIVQLGKLISEAVEQIEQDRAASPIGSTKVSINPDITELVQCDEGHGLAGVDGLGFNLELQPTG